MSALNRLQASQTTHTKWLRKKELRALVAPFKEQPCADCGVRFPSYCMDFDHREGVVKVNAVSKLISHGCSVEMLLAEIAKCDLVCSNCHRIRTHMRGYLGSAKPAANDTQLELKIESNEEPTP